MYGAASDRVSVHADAELEREEEIARWGCHGHDAGIKGEDGVARLQLRRGRRPRFGYGREEDLLGVVWEGKED